MKRKFIILGGGLAGLEVARKLDGYGEDFIVLEKQGKIGGLAQTSTTSEYKWDFGVHALYSRDKVTMDFFKSLPVKMNLIKRKVKVFHRSKNNKIFLLDYPFEMGIKDLPLNDKLECILGYLLSTFQRRKKPATLLEWINQYCGYGIAKHFMLPYNGKIWNCDLSQISTELVNVKIEPAPIVDFLLSAMGKHIVGRRHQAEFLYPELGIQSFVECLAQTIKNRIIFNSEVAKIVRNENGNWLVITQDGNEYSGTDLISTIPLDDLITKVRIPNLPNEINVLKHNDTYFIMIGLKEGYTFNYINDCQWVFFKGDESFYRLSMMHTFSPNFPITLVAEITKKDDEPEWEPQVLIRKVIKDLLRLNIISSEKWIKSTDIKLVDHTYPIPTIGLNKEKNNVRNILKKHHIYLVGRNGNWDYMNMDNVIMSADKLCKEVHENI